MKSSFLEKESNHKLILFFNGWGMDSSVVSHLKTEDYDVKAFCHYNHDFSIAEDSFSKYDEIILIAWSMGVWAAARALEGLNIQINRAIAINGTLEPVNDQLGIPEGIFKGTIDHFSERNKQKFDRRMLGSKDQFLKFNSKKMDRTLDNQLEELKIIYDLALNTNASISFDKAIIGKEDLIFPVQNQQNAWEGKAEIEYLDSPHFPFYAFSSWSEILDL